MWGVCGECGACGEYEAKPVYKPIAMVTFPTALSVQ